MDKLTYYLKDKIFKKISDKINHAVMVLSHDLKIIDFNKVSNTLFNEKLSIGRSIQEICRETDINFDISSAGVKFTYDSTSLSNEEINKIQWEITPLEDEENRAYLIIGFNDIKNQQLEKESRTLKIFFESIIASLPGHIFWKNTECVYLGCNDRMAEICCLKSRNDIIGKTDRELIWGDKLAEEFILDDKIVMKTGKPKFNIIENHRYANKGNQVMLTNKVPLKDNSGNVIGILGMAVDITEQKQVEQILKREKFKAESASKTKSQFIANISHDIRTPITGILGLAESLKNAVQTQHDKEDAQLLINSTQELLNLLNSIINVVLLETGNYEPRNENFSPEKVLEHNKLLLSASIKNKGLNFRLEIDKNVPEIVNGDKVSFDRIILNLMSNAIKFTSKGGVNVTMSVTSYEADTCLLKIIIQDTGIGISPEDQSQIFENFYRGASSYTGLYSGHGIGLYTVKKFLAAMDGTINLVSAEGVGSTFTVFIPLKVIEKSHRDQALVKMMESAEKPELVMHDNFSSKKYKDESLAEALIVEDNMLAARMVNQMLKKLNCIGTIATTGMEAIEFAHKKKYKLILMDIGLPDVNGIEVSRMIISDSINRDTAIVALTGHLSKERRQACLDAGMLNMFTKPISQSSMQHLFKLYLSSDVCAPINPNEVVLDNQDLIIDLDKGAKLAGGNFEIAKSMLFMLARNLTADMSKIQLLAAQKNYMELYDYVHRFYGGLCYCGVPRIYRQASRLYTLLKSKKYSDINTLIKKLEFECSQFLNELKKLS